MAIRLNIRRRLHRILCRIPYYCEYVSNRSLKKRQKALPKPLAPRMKHQNLSSIAIDPITNANCLFLTMLPLEIRLQIYTEVFSYPKFDRWVTLFGKGYRLTASCCCHPDIFHQPFLHLCLLSLPKTCRQIYIESLPFLYAHQPLCFVELSNVVSFTRTILPTRLSLIRYLCLHLDFCYLSVLSRDPLTNLTLDETWDLIATQMTGLRELDVWVVLRNHEFGWEDDMVEREKKVLGGLAKCRGLRAFNAMIEHWSLLGPADGVDEREGARRWREELARKMTRPRSDVGEIEDKTFAVDLGYEANEGSILGAHSHY